VLKLEWPEFRVVSTRQRSTDGRDAYTSHIFLNNSDFDDCRKPMMSTQRKKSISESLDKLLDMLRVKLAAYMGKSPSTEY
jgi:hypothetical protein